MVHKYLILVGRTFIATFFTVNFFNIIPLDLKSNSWLTQVSMLIVDTASLLLLGLICLKLCSVYLINNYDNKSSSTINNPDNTLINKEEKNIDLINKISGYLMVFFIILGLFQSYLFINGVKQINFNYSYKYNEINDKYNIQKNKLESYLSNKELDSQNIKKDKIRSLEAKKNKYILELDKNITKTRFLLIRGNIKVFIMSLIWAYGLYKLSSLNRME